MKPRHDQPSKHACYLAYRLGCLPYVLLGGSKQRHAIAWDNLQPLFEWAVAEALQAVDVLRPYGPKEDRSQANLAHDAITAWWNSILLNLPDVERAYFEQGGPSKTREDMLFLAESRESTWGSFVLSVGDFCKSLVSPYVDFAKLGNDVGDVITWRLDMDRLDADVKNLVDMLARLQAEACRMAERYELLVGLDCDLAIRAENRFWTDYFYWVQEQVLFLHKAIVERLGPSTLSAKIAPILISASEAVAVSIALGVPLSPSTLNKKTKVHPPPFQSWSVEEMKWLPPRFFSKSTKRIVEINSFVAWVLEQKRLGKEKEPTGTGDAEFKAKVALAALKDEATIPALAEKHQLEVRDIRVWVHQLCHRAYELFKDD